MDTLKRQIVELIKLRLHPYLIILFGSVANGTSRTESDIDVGFLSDTEVSHYELFSVAQEIADKVNRNVDLINLETASTVFQAQVVSTGTVLYCSDKKRWMEFQMKALSMYVKLNEERRGIIEAIKESGTVYGQ